MRVKFQLKILVCLFFFVNELSAQAIEARDCAEIKIQGEQSLKNFELLLNQISDPFFFPSERNELIQNNTKEDEPNRLFYHSSIIIEDDLNWPGTTDQNTGLYDKKVKRYLNDFDLNYTKSEEATVFFSNLHFGPIQENQFIFFHIVFDSELKGHFKDNSDLAYPKHKRVATLRVEKINGQWKTYIQQVNFYRPGFEFVVQYLDSDCDGVINAEDNCPEQVGLKEYNGCPPPPMQDSDQDGIVDKEDPCPNEMGPWCTQGCPTQITDPLIPQKVIWQESYGDMGADIAFDITKNEQGQIVFAGETEIRGKGKDLYMAILDPCQKSIRNRVVTGGNQDDGARKILQIGSGQYALAGYTESNSSGTRDAWLLLTDGIQKTGEKFFGGNNSSEEFSDLASDSNGHLFFTGQKEGKLWLVQTSLEGQLLQETVYSESTRGSGSALAVSPNGEVYVTGYEQIGTQENLIVLHYNQDSGQLEKIFKRENAKGYDIIVDKEEKLVVIGTTYTKRTRDDIFVIQLDLKGGTVWNEAKIFGGLGIDVGCSIYETAEGNYLLAGYSNSHAHGARREKLWANLLSKSGNPIWGEPLFFGNQFSDRAYGITQIEANRIIVAGFSHSSLSLKNGQKSDFWLVGIKTLE